MEKDHVENNDNDSQELRAGVLLREKTNDLMMDDNNGERKDKDILDELKKRIVMKMNLYSDDD